MTDKTLDQETRTALRKLAHETWEKELADELRRLAAVLAAMDRGETAAVDAAEHIHEFHETVYRKLMEMKSTHEPALLLGRAVVKGFLGEEDIPPDALPLVKKAILFYRSKTSVFDRRPLPPSDEEEA